MPGNEGNEVSQQGLFREGILADGIVAPDRSEALALRDILGTVDHGSQKAIELLQAH